MFLPVVLALSAAASALAGPVPFVLAAGGRAKAVVVAYGGDTNGVGYAANELAKYLGKITGAAFLVADKPVPGYGTLLVGAPYKASRPEELCIRMKGKGEMEFTGDGPRGTLYAVYDFLETLGVLFAANDYEYIPSIPDLSVPGDYAKTDAPFMQYRDGWGVITFDTPYSLKLRMQGGSDAGLLGQFGGGTADIAQNLTGKWLNPGKYFKEHPEWYAIIPGTNERGPLWPCVTCDKMYEELFREIEEEIRKRPEVREISLGMTDAPYFCGCENCLKLVAQYPDPDGAKTMDVEMVEVCNRVGRHFAKKYPRLRFNFLNYGGRLPENENLRLEPNVGAGVAELWRNHGLSADNNERSVFALQRVANRSSRAPGMGPYIWDYYCNFASYLVPYPNLYTYGQTARYYKSLNVSGVGAQMQFCIAGDMAPLHFWLFAKLLWNPDQDERALVRDYIEKAYGKAAPMIQEYVDLLEHARLRQRYTWFGCYVDATDHYLTDEDCLRIHQLFEEAEAAVRGDPDRRRNVRRASLAAVTMEMFRHYDMAGPAAKRRIKLASREELVEKWHAIVDDSMHFARLGDICEGGCADPTGFRLTFANPDRPAFRTNRFASVVVPPAKMTGGKKMTTQKDGDGTEYRQFKVQFSNELESAWMNPDFAEIGYTVHTNANPALDETGDWYVFATVRIGATEVDDKGAAYFGHYQPWIVNGVTLRGLMETADMPVQACRADSAKWRTLCLGKRRLVEGSRIWIMPGILHPTDYQDVRSFTLLSPALLDGGAAASLPPERRLRTIECRAFDQGAAAILHDAFDNFDFARLTNAAPAAIEYTVKPEDAGTWHVLLDLRSGASSALDSFAATASIVSSERWAECASNLVPVRVNVTGSLGDEAWQVVSLGAFALEPGMKIRLEPGMESAPFFTDLRRIHFVAPAYFEQTQPAVAGQ